MEQQGFNNNFQHVDFDNLMPPELYNAALYLRFSRDDGQANDSTSIESQRMMLEKYCKDNGYKVHDTYVDDGYTGLNFDRPAFQRMTQDIEAGKVNLVITKDQSRLGRDYIQTGYYIEMYFTDHNVRYIAVNDGADTAKPENADFMPFRNVFNNMYSKDISRKTKSAKRQRALNGLFINSNAPYGYKKHPDTCNKLVIDGDAAEIVKEIFQLAIEGKGLTAIAKTMTAKGVLIPSAYKTAQGLKGFDRRNRIATDLYQWGYSTVCGILKDRTYCGDIVNRKSEVVNYKTGKQVTVPKEKRIICENMHEAIISREDYERVQGLISARYMPPKHQQENIFRGLLFCTECGRRMIQSHQTIKTACNTSERKPTYRCNTHYKHPTECLHHNYIYADKLRENISVSVRKVLTLAKGNAAALSSVMEMTGKDDKRDKLTSEKGRIEKRLSTLTVLVRKLYEDYATEILSADNYKEFLTGYQKEQAELKTRLTAIDGELDGSDSYEDKFKKLQAIAAAYADQTDLTAEMLNKLIERIEIQHPVRADGKKTQQINIIYRFIETTL